MIMEIAFFFTFILACLCFVLYLATRRQLDFERGGGKDTLGVDSGAKVNQAELAIEVESQKHCYRLLEEERARVAERVNKLISLNSVYVTALTQIARQFSGGNAHELAQAALSYSEHAGQDASVSSPKTDIPAPIGQSAKDYYVSKERTGVKLPNPIAQILDDELSTQECKHEGGKFMNVLDLPVCSECFAVTVDTSNGVSDD